MKRNGIAMALLGAVSSAIALPAAALSISFDFNSVAISGSYGNGLGKIGGDSAVETYMNAILGGYGASVDAGGTLATATYNGEGHVNGETLGTSDGGTHHTGNDTFVMNDDFGTFGSAKDRFSLAFTGFYIYSVSFDWEIFPNASCPASSSSTACANNPTTNSHYPDISLLADGSGVWSTLATTPSSGHKDPQELGHLSTLALNGATTLTFVDWPAEIGMDNLVIEGCTIKSPDCISRQDAPEPGTLFGLGAAALAAWGVRRRSRQAVR